MKGTFSSYSALLENSIDKENAENEYLNKFRTMSQSIEL
jgi:hypothetical protein